MQHYEPHQTYRWNFEQAPRPPAGVVAPVLDWPGTWTFCGRPVATPLGIAAGPLLNGRWLLHYAALGFAVLTYKTVRSSARACYPLPNLVPVGTDLGAGREIAVAAEPTMTGSWAISFGMPSQAPDYWRADVAWTRQHLSPAQTLVVSVVASAEAGWSLEQVAADYAQCGRWAVEAGADAVEANFSCPNVDTCDGSLFEQPAAAALIAKQLREAVGSCPLVVKIGYIHDLTLIDPLVDALAPWVDAISMTNCLPRRVLYQGQELFEGKERGIGGAAIREASVRQVERVAAAIHERGADLRLVGVGGIDSAAAVRQYLDAGAESVQLATAVMIEPEIAQRIRQEW